jgi:hypothetical protein
MMDDIKKKKDEFKYHRAASKEEVEFNKKDMTDFVGGIKEKIH